MNILKLTAFICLFFLSIGAHGQLTVIDYSSNWSYYDSENEPVDQGRLTWTALDYDDSSWSSGVAQLGYGDGDEGTTLNSNAQAAYFRYEFMVPDSSSYDGLEIELIYDDGAIIYLNGLEIWRVNMPDGPVTYGTYSSSQSPDNQLITNAIEHGITSENNIIAVELHQHNSSSSDLSFDLQLILNTLPKR